MLSHLAMGGDMGHCSFHKPKHRRQTSDGLPTLNETALGVILSLRGPHVG